MNILEKDIYEEKIDELKKYIKEIKGTNGEMIASLYKGQEIFGYISEDVKNIIIKETMCSSKKINEIVEFNGIFTKTLKGKYHIGVCLGETCCKKGAREVLKNVKKYLGIEIGEKTKDELFSLDIIRCVGACGLAPVIVVNKEIYGGNEVKSIEKFFLKIKNKK